MLYSPEYLKNLELIKWFLNNQKIKSHIRFPDLEVEGDFVPYISINEKGVFAWYEETKLFHKFFIQTKKETLEIINPDLLSLLREFIPTFKKYIKQ